MIMPGNPQSFSLSFCMYLFFISIFFSIFLKLLDEPIINKLINEESSRLNYYTSYEIYDVINYGKMMRGEAFTFGLKLGDWILLNKLSTVIKDLELKLGPKKLKKKFCTPSITNERIEVTNKSTRKAIPTDDDLVLKSFYELLEERFVEDLNGSAFIDRDRERDRLIWCCIFCGKYLSVGYKLKKDGMPTFISTNILRNYIHLPFVPTFAIVKNK